MNREVERYETPRGARIYRLPLKLFPGFGGYAHLVLWQDLVVLVDAGSGFGDSNEHLEAGLATVRERFGEPVDWDRLTHVLVSHGHIDHFGGLCFVHSRTQAPIGVHELDLRVLTNYEERLTVIARRLREYMDEAGVEEEEREAIMRLYLLNKHLFSSVEVDFSFEAAGMAIGPLRILHVPGHCPGQVVFLVDDVLLSGDHVLKGTTPHQAPERLSLNTGLGHYLASLEKLHPLSPRLQLTLGGHEGPIEDLAARIDDIRALHESRLRKVLEILDEPHTINEVAHQLFPDVEGYHILLALEEAGAHVEYLAQRGYLGITNLHDLEAGKPVPIRYERLQSWAPPLSALLGSPRQQATVPDVEDPEISTPG